jgi:TatD DNase family protein
MLDIHTHLYWDSYDADRDAVVKRARAAGVREMLVIGCTLDESRQAIDVAKKYPDMFASVGIHPHEFNEEASRTANRESAWIEQLRGLAQDEKVKAIGECGLDYFSRDNGSPLADEQKQFQKEGFEMQIALARELGLPLIIHTRPSEGTMDAYEDMLAIFHDEPSQVILHCYMGDTEVTEKFLALPNVFFSFAGNITYPTKKAVAGTKDDLTETVKRVPLERLFVETDCPFLSPQEKRGERNEPAYVRMTAEKVRILKGIDATVLEMVLGENFQKVFARNKA